MREKSEGKGVQGKEEQPEFWDTQTSWDLVSVSILRIAGQLVSLFPRRGEKAETREKKNTATRMKRRENRKRNIRILVLPRNLGSVIRYCKVSGRLAQIGWERRVR